jgi:Methyltransferase domain
MTGRITTGTRLVSRIRGGLSWLRGREACAAALPAPVRQPFNLDEWRAGTWDIRAEAATRMWSQEIIQARQRGAALPAEWAIVDLGCGDQRLAGALVATGIPHRYQGYDLLPQSPTCKKLDLTRELPPGRADMTFALGLLEYLPDLPQFFNRLRKSTRWAIVSYVAADSGAYRAADAAKRGWLHHYRSTEIAEQFAAAGFCERASAVIDTGRTFLWLLEA